MSQELGADVQALEFVPNVTHDERPAMEDEARRYYTRRYPSFRYYGFRGFEPGSSGSTINRFGPLGEKSIQTRSEQPFYFPVLYLEPLSGNEVAVDFDMYSSAARRESIDLALRTWKLTATGRLLAIQDAQPGQFSVLLLRPGIPLLTHPDLKPRVLGCVGD